MASILPKNVKYSTELYGQLPSDHVLYITCAGISRADIEKFLEDSLSTIKKFLNITSKIEFEKRMLFENELPTHCLIYFKNAEIVNAFFNVDKTGNFFTKTEKIQSENYDLKYEYLNMLYGCSKDCDWNCKGKCGSVAPKILWGDIGMQELETKTPIEYILKDLNFKYTVSDEVQEKTERLIKSGKIKENMAKHLQKQREISIYKFYHKIFNARNNILEVSPKNPQQEFPFWLTKEFLFQQFSFFFKEWSNKYKDWYPIIMPQYKGQKIEKFIVSFPAEKNSECRDAQIILTDKNIFLDNKTSFQIKVSFASDTR